MLTTVLGFLPLQFLLKTEKRFFFSNNEAQKFVQKFKQQHVSYDFKPTEDGKRNGSKDFNILN